MSEIAYLQANPAAFALAAGALGLVVGSFLNVVIHRLPKMMEAEWRDHCAELAGEEPAAPAERYDLVAPRSACPACGHVVRALENVPVLSYAWLRGRCSACGWRIPIRYPVVELLGGILAAAVALRYGFGWAAAGGMLLTWALVALAFIDADTQLLPDAITLPFLWLGIGFNLFDTYVPLRESVVGAIAGYGILWLVYQGFRLVTGKEGMGYGDFKLLALLGAWMGWHMLPAVILLSSVAGALIGLALIAGAGRDRAKPLPFGPYLAIAGWLTFMYGADITGAYLRVSGLAD